MAVKLMIGHVKFTLKATNAQRDAMSRVAAAAGIDWFGMLAIAESVCVEAAQRATDAAVSELADVWSAEDWQAAQTRFGMK